jgi:hypothetical protein
MFAVATISYVPRQSRRLALPMRDSRDNHVTEKNGQESQHDMATTYIGPCYHGYREAIASYDERFGHPHQPHDHPHHSQKGYHKGEDSD